MLNAQDFFISLLRSTSLSDRIFFLTLGGAVPEQSLPECRQPGSEPAGSREFQVSQTQSTQTRVHALKGVWMSLITLV